MLFQFSRYTFCEVFADGAGRSFLDARRPFRFQAFPDNRSYVVTVGDTLPTIAGQFYQPLDRGCGLWWVIADFQPNPIIDPTIELVPGSVLVLPSIRCLNENIFSPARRRESRV